MYTKTKLSLSATLTLTDGGLTLSPAQTNAGTTGMTSRSPRHSSIKVHVNRLKYSIARTY